jgi:hypothetical protein
VRNWHTIFRDHFEKLWRTRYDILLTKFLWFIWTAFFNLTIKLIQNHWFFRFSTTIVWYSTFNNLFLIILSICLWEFFTKHYWTSSPIFKERYLRFRLRLLLLFYDFLMLLLNWTITVSSAKLWSFSLMMRLLTIVSIMNSTCSQILNAFQS